MRKVPVLLSASLAVLLAVPAGTAGWSAFGSYEPDNSFDSLSFIWGDGPGATKNRVYFNGFVQQSSIFIGIGNVNPNVGALETRNQPIGAETYAAILGVWIDCNGDNYIGMAETAVREYDDRLLTDKTICPATTGTANTWNGQPNYNGWVTELIPIGGHGIDTDGHPDSSDDLTDKRVIRDTAAAIWGDIGRPNDPGPESGGGSCPISPVPRGTWRDTGGLIEHADCGTGLVNRWNTVWGPSVTVANPVTPITVPLLGDPLGVRFTNPDDGRSSPVGRIPLFGDDSSERAAVKAFDCERQFFHMGDLLNESGVQEASKQFLGPQGINGSVHDITFWTPDPRLGDTSNPTIPGQVNRTFEEIGRGETNGLGAGAGAGCDTSNDNGRDFYGALQEGENDAVDVTDKRESDFNMRFDDGGRVVGGGRGSFPSSLIRGGQAGMSSDKTTSTQTEWAASNLLLTGTPRTVVTRINVAEGTANPGPAAARYVTFYANVGAVTLAKFVTPGGTGEYGASQCGGVYTGASPRTQNGWQCVASLWNLDGNGQPKIEEEGGNGKPGKTYRLRDVDCQDGSNSIGVPLGAPALGAEPCIPHGS